MSEHEEANHDSDDGERGDPLGDDQRNAPSHEPDGRELSADTDQAGSGIEHGAGSMGGHWPLAPQGDGAGEAPAEVGALYQAASFRSAPLPDPAEFSGYEAVLPGAADRIVRMAEKDQDSLIAAREGDIKDRHVAAEAEAAALKVTVYGFAGLPYVLTATAIVMACLDKDLQALVSGVSAAVSFTPQVINAIRRKSDKDKSDT